MWAILLAAISYTLSDTNVLQPPKPALLSVWTSAAPTVREAVNFKATGGTQVRLWLYRAKPEVGSQAASRPMVLFFYGSNEDLVHEQTLLAWLRDSLHVDAVCFDFPGYGFSTGRISAKATRDIALEEYDFVHDHLAVPLSAGNPSPRIVAHGWSIGTGMAPHVASERKTAAVILRRR